MKHKRTHKTKLVAYNAQGAVIHEEDARLKPLPQFELEMDGVAASVALVENNREIEHRPL